MKTAIRLQNHGKRNHPYWWIVVMGYYRNRTGRIVEHVGYWIPRKTRSVQRSVILNKPRLRYWLAMGASPSKKIAGFLSWADMWPNPVIKYGYKTMYRTKNFDPKNHGFYEVTMGTPQHTGLHGRFYEQQREMEEENLFKRKVQIQQELDKQVKISKKDDVGLDETLEERTKKFYEIRNELYEHERDIKKLPSAKRDQLYRELNQRASKGINAEKLSPKLLNLDPEEDAQMDPQVFGKNRTRESILLEKKMQEMDMSKAIAKNQMQYAKYLDQAQNMTKKYDETFHMLKPASKEELISMIIEKNEGITPKDAEEKANDLWEIVKEIGMIPSKLDLLQWTEDVPEIERVKDIYKEEYIKNSKVYIPTPYPVNPFPDITKYDPNDYHEVSFDPEQRIDHNKAYDLPGVDDLKLKSKLQRGTNLTPRNPRRRTGFSTLQKEFSAMNFSFYSTVLRKIEEIKKMQI